MHRALQPPLWVAVLAILALSGCPTPTDPCVLTPVYESASLALFSMNPCTGELALGRDGAPEALFGVVPDGVRPIAWAGDDELEVTFRQGRFTYEGFFDGWRRLDELGRFTGVGRWEGGTNELPTLLAVGPGPRDSIHLRLEVAGDVDRVSLAFACNDGEHLYGTGARPDGTDHTGKSRMMVTTEQGVGQADYPMYEFDPILGRIGDSYFPVPWVVSDRGTGLAIGGTPMARMYLCTEPEAEVLRFETWGNVLDLYVFAADSPRQAVADWTMASGPPVAAPDWAFGPWIAVQRGTEPMMAIAELLRSEQIPATALWVQDWIGGRDQALFGYDLYYHWEWDEETYPDLPGAIDELHDMGLAFLGYFNPFITEPHVEWDEANELGYLPLGPDGEPYTFAIVDRFGSQVDLDQPEAVDWARAYMDAAPAMGQDGWMCDFAEWLPLDATVGDGLSGVDRHNAYPLQWQELNMAVLDDALGEGNGLCFNRSGWAGTQAIAPVTWGGDQETGFGRDDGLPTAREIGVGLGLSGIGRYGSDIAGFSSVGPGPSTKELYFRWVEMSAFEPVFRTHDGLEQTENHHWNSDPETLEHFRRYARLHLQLLPYLKVLDGQYMTDGLPLMRHTILVESGDGDAWETLRDAPDQHFLGDDLLIAPVVEEGAVSRSVVLPAGRWYGLMDGTSLDAGDAPAEVQVDAPLEEIPVFARAGAILPMGDFDVVTSYPESNAEVIGAADRADRLHLVVFAGGDGAMIVGDATWTFSADEAVGRAPSLDGVPLAALCDGDDATNCLLSDDPTTGSATWRIDWGDGARELAGEGWSLSVDDSSGLSGTVTLRYPPE
jgi:sulfoquinovosidase